MGQGEGAGQPEDPVCLYQRLKAQFQMLILGITSSDKKKKNKPKTFKKQSCSNFAQGTSQPVLLQHLPSWAVQQGRLLFIKRN